MPESAGRRTIPSCINIISGPSSTADIQLIKVVRIHGPVKAVYLIIEIAERICSLDINLKKAYEVENSVKDNLT
ncbi:LUD domain-containing protein [Shigella flexneri]